MSSSPNGWIKKTEAVLRPLVLMAVLIGGILTQPDVVRLAKAAAAVL